MLAVLLNYGASEKAVLNERFYRANLADHRKAVKEIGQTVAADTFEKKLPTFFRNRRTAARSSGGGGGGGGCRQILPEDNFTFCVSRFVLLLSDFSAGLANYVEMVTKNDFSDLCVFLFLILLVSTDRRFVTNFRVIESVTSLLHYNLDSVSAVLWYKGPMNKDRQRVVENPTSLVRTLAKMVHEFFPGMNFFFVTFFLDPVGIGMVTGTQQIFQNFVMTIIR